MTRTFTVTGKDAAKMKNSTFESKTPASAASKAFNALCGKAKKCDKTITVVDDNSLKEYKYKISRVLSNKKVEIAGKTVTFKYTTKVISLKI